MLRSDPRETLLDAAERLFAEHGIPTVSDRKIAVAAENTNNSAVAYYFGGRSGLLRTLIDRHLVALEEPRRRLLAESGTVLGDVRAMVLPVTDALASLPQPSWRARFFDQALNDPTTVQLLRESEEQGPVAAEVFAAMTARLEALGTLDRAEIAGRVALMTRLIASACAEIERRSHAQEQPAEWAEAGRFLCDAVAGMLTAPISAR